MIELTPAQADLVMANIFPEHRRWCPASCGWPPGEMPINFGCACIGCIYGALSWEDWRAWQEREAQRDPTPYILNQPVSDPPTLMERLAAYKVDKHANYD